MIRLGIALGRRLSEAREAKNFTLEQSAKAIEISPERLVGLESGTGSINSLEIHRLAKLYKITLRSLLVIEGEAHQHH